MRIRATASLQALVLLLVPLTLAVILHPAPLPTTLTGQVLDGSQPLAGATVRLKGDADTATTDSAGRFRLRHGRAGSGRVTAWKRGYFIAGAALDSPLLLALHPLPKEDNRQYQWVDPAPDPRGKHNCANCHAKIYREWQSSGHARGVSGRHFRDLYAGTAGKKQGIGWSLLGEHAAGAGVCAACHAPTAPAGAGLRSSLLDVQGVAAKGVHCDYCHKVSGEGAGKLGLTHGRYKLELLRPKQGQLFFGPLDDVDRGEDAYAAFYRNSRYCAACHEGIVFGVHVYSTYSEWRASPARKRGQHCQDCHMKPTGLMTNIAPDKGGIERDPWTLSNHRFFAGNREEMLRRCLKVSATIARRGSLMRATVTIRVEGAGHRVPTGFIDRHLLLVVEGFGRDGQPVTARVGSVLPAAAGAELAGKSGKLYAKLLADEQGCSPVPFWRVGAEATDTRLWPGRTEHVGFDFPAGLHRLRVRVLYRRFWKEVTRTKGWPDRDVVVVDRVVAAGF